MAALAPPLPRERRGAGRSRGFNQIIPCLSPRAAKGTLCLCNHRNDILSMLRRSRTRNELGIDKIFFSVVRGETPPPHPRAPTKGDSPRKPYFGVTDAEITLSSLEKAPARCNYRAAAAPHLQTRRSRRYGAAEGKAATARKHTQNRTCHIRKRGAFFKVLMSPHTDNVSRAFSPLIRQQRTPGRDIYVLTW